MYRGTVTSWQLSKGHGFITAEAGEPLDGEQFFVHHTGIAGGGLRLEEQKAVQFDIDASKVAPRRRRQDGTAVVPKRAACNVQGDAVAAASAGGGLQGTVRQWRRGKGYGFIRGDDGASVYVHLSSFCGGRLEPGACISYDAHQTGHKSGQPVAQNVGGPGVVAAGAVGGVVKWYNPVKGFGFLTSDAGVDCFVHRTAIGDGCVLQEGKAVQYDVSADGRRDGNRAENVTGQGVIDDTGVAAAPLLAAAHLPADRAGGERRRDPTDGQYHSREEFLARYGDHQQWDQQEQRPSPLNGRLYPKEMFVKHFGGTAEWDAARPAVHLPPSRTAAAGAPPPLAAPQRLGSVPHAAVAAAGGLDARQLLSTGVGAAAAGVPR